MGSCPASEGDDRDLFLAEVSDAAALADRSRVEPAKRAPKARAATTSTTTTPWTVEMQGNRITARAHGVNRKTVDALAGGSREPRATLDLHRLDVDSAEHTLARFLTDNRDVDQQCVLVVSGRGKHSDGDGVLRRAVVHWITGPMSRHALALSSAAPKHGGAGAFYVLLRKA